MKSQQEDKIIQAIEFIKNELGFTLVNEDWGNEKEKCVDALGAVCLFNNKQLSSNNEEIIMELLAVDQHWITAFISGFDDTPWNLKVILIDKEYDSLSEDIKNNLTDAFNLGVDLRKRFNPINYYKSIPVK